MRLPRSVQPAQQTSYYWRQLFDRTHVAILIANDDATYVDANRGACRLLGLTREQIVGRSVADFIRPELATGVTTQWQAFLRDGEQNGLMELRHADGIYRRVGFYAEAHFVPGFHCSFLREIEGPGDKMGGGVLTICPWTKRVWENGEWLSIESYLQRKLHVRIAHGMSPHAPQKFFGQPGSPPDKA